MNEKQRGSSTGANDTGGEKPPGIFRVHGVRYQVTDVARAAAFYTDHLGFRLEHQLMGHANVGTTLNVYTQVLDGSVRDAVERIGGELFTIVHRPDQAGALTD